MLDLKGQVLIASGDMDAMDTEFQSVWVILDHTADVTTLFCISRTVEEEIEIDVRRKIPELPESIQILRGGSMDGVDKHMIFVHREPLKLNPSVELAPKFRISMKHENVFKLEDSHAANCRIVLGFDTWDPEQLEEEIREGFWSLRSIAHVGATFFRFSPSELWSRLQLQ